MIIIRNNRVFIKDNEEFVFLGKAYEYLDDETFLAFENFFEKFLESNELVEITLEEIIKKYKK